MSNTISKTKIIGLKELRLNIEKYIKMIGKGHSFTVVRKSNPIFKLEPIDKWGDEGTWETVVDFTSLKKDIGIPIDNLINKLKAGL